MAKYSEGDLKREREWGLLRDGGFTESSSTESRGIKKEA